MHIFQWYRYVCQFRPACSHRIGYNTSIVGAMLALALLLGTAACAGTPEGQSPHAASTLTVTPPAASTTPLLSTTPPSSGGGAVFVVTAHPSSYTPIVARTLISATATCPAGDQLVSGGFYINFRYAIVDARLSI
jgi:hypothetical protein